MVFANLHILSGFPSSIIIPVVQKSLKVSLHPASLILHITPKFQLGSFWSFSYETLSEAEINTEWQEGKQFSAKEGVQWPWSDLAECWNMGGWPFKAVPLRQGTLGLFWSPIEQKISYRVALWLTSALERTQLQAIESQWSQQLAKWIARSRREIQAAPHCTHSGQFLDSRKKAHEIPVFQYQEPSVELVDPYMCHHLILAFHVLACVHVCT